LLANKLADECEGKTIYIEFVPSPSIFPATLWRRQQAMKSQLCFVNYLLQVCQKVWVLISRVFPFYCQQHKVQISSRAAALNSVGMIGLVYS